MQLNPYQLYLVTGRFGLTEEKFLEVVEAACKSGVTCLQLREKTLSTKDFYELALKVKKITDHYQLPLIINDRVDICLAVDAAGVHIGDDELPVHVTRQLIGPYRLLGVSAKSVERGLEAKKAGANYLGTGAIFPTQTKETPLTTISTLKEIVQTVSIPVVAIGGIKTDNISTLRGTNIAGIAVVSDIMLASNPEEKVEIFKEQINLLNEQEEE